MSNGRQIRRKLEQNASQNGNAEMDIGLGAKMADPEQRGQADPNKIRQVEDITAMFMMMIHGEQTRDSVMDTLKSNPDPSKAIPLTANMLMTRVEQQAKKRRQKLPDDAKIAAAQYMVPDLAMLGNSAGIWQEQITQDQLPEMLQDTMQIYIRQGLKNKTIDPVKLQRDAEALMTDEQKSKAMEFGGGEIPREPTPSMAVAQKVDEAVGKERAKTEQARAQAEALKGNMRGAAAGRHEAEQTQQNAAMQGPA